MPHTYSTWEYYHNVYLGTLSESEYTRRAAQAAGEINRRTFSRATTAPESMSGALCDCECELADCLADFAQSYALLPEGIQSINNDGLALSAGSGGGASDSRSAAQTARVRHICQAYLLYPVNLLYPGVVGC